MSGLDWLRSHVMQAGASEFWFWAAVLIAGTAAAFYLTFRSIVRARLIEDTPTSKIRSAPQGYVELIGTGKWLEGPAILAPLSGRECTWYRYKVSEALFKLVDDTGECVIDPDGAEVIPSQRDQWYGDARRPTGSRQPTKGSHRDPGWKRVFALGAGRYRYTESLLSPGEDLYALGSFQTVGHDIQADLKQATGAILREWKRDPARLQLFDRDHNGQIDGQEYELAAQAAAEQALRERLRRIPVKATNVLRKPQDDPRPFLLAERSQRRLAKRYRLAAAASITGFVLGGSSAVWLVMTRFSV